jgi:3-deoxy-D-manno-octulosonic-acid transferase
MRRLFLTLYSVLYTLGFVIYLPFYYWRARREGRRLHLAARLGQRVNWPGAPRQTLETVWIHAVSVGEVNAIKPLVERLSEGRQLFISTTTETGQRLARQLYQSRASLLYFPLDWRWSCRRCLERIRPDLVLIAETEIWPNFLAEARRAAIPVVLVNGRISERSFGRYRRIRPLLKPVLGWFHTLCVQSEADRERILALGAPIDRTLCVGNLKYDYELRPDPEKNRLVERLGAILRPYPGALVWVCASTREGEEEQLVTAFLALKAEFPDLRCLVAPRHPHRAPDVARLFRERGLETLLRSGIATAGASRIDAIVLDTVGELAYLFEIADVVFIGGSLVPWGGHNIIEAAEFGKSILFGPHMKNFQEIADTFLAARGAIQVADPQQLVSRARELLNDPFMRSRFGENARAVVRQNRGACRRTVEIVREIVEERRNGRN